MPETVSFAKDILPLFTELDIDHMNDQEIYLSDYAYMSDPGNAGAVLESVTNGSMPPTWGGGEGAWPPEKVELLRKWIEGGYQP